MGNYNDSVNKIVDLADQQINKGMSALHTEMDSWERRRQAIFTTVEQEIDQLSKRYSEEVVQVSTILTRSNCHIFREGNG
jgi:phage gp36-like protein